MPLVSWARRCVYETGHRGAWGDLPENTLESFKYLFENKISAYETDILLTKDLIPVVYHDFRLNPALTKDSKGNWIENDDIKIFDLSYDQLSEKIIRKTKEGIKIFNADLSTIEGISQGNMIMQSHDIVYITPNFNLGTEIAQDINSIFSFISTLSLVWLTISQINQ